MKLLLLRLLWEKAEDSRLVQSGKAKTKGWFSSYLAVMKNILNSSLNLQRPGKKKKHKTGDIGRPLG